MSDYFIFQLLCNYKKQFISVDLPIITSPIKEIILYGFVILGIGLINDNIIIINNY